MARSTLLMADTMFKKAKRRATAVSREFANMLIHGAGFIPSHHLRRLLYRLDGVHIGKGSAIHMGAVFYNPPGIFIGQDTIIGERAVLDGREKLTIGSHVAIASEVMIYNCEHDVHDENFSPKGGPVVIEDYVFIGPRVIILPGVMVGRGAVIAAGAVVTKNVAPNTIVGGVPAKVIGQRKSKEHVYKLGRASWFR